MPNTITPDEFPRLLAPGSVVYVPGGAAEPRPLLEALRAAPARCAGVTFVGVYLPGLNDFDFTTLHPTARMRVFMMSPAFRAGFDAGRVDFLPIPYSAIPDYLARVAGIDLAVLHVAPPDARGRCSLGVAADFAPAALEGAGRIVALVNPEMPAPPHAPWVAQERLDYVVEQAAPLPEFPTGRPTADLEAIAGHIAGLVREGDTLQLGIGRFQAAVLQALRGARGLRLHGGMISDPVLELIESGAIAEEGGAPDRAPITTGLALGTQRLYEAVRSQPLICFAPVSHTHAIGTLGGIERLVAINSVLEVDLLGQANAEAINGRQVSAAGGLVDFIRGARLSPGGRAILALPSTARGGTVSRIVPRLEGGIVSVARGDIDLVVTEHGVADLRYRSLSGRAEALIAIAAPPLRPALQTAWEALLRAM